MKLYYSPNSPYVRKVVVLARELELWGRIEALATNVWDENAQVQKDNPLGRIPCLVTDDGVVLYDSPVISEYLATEFGNEHFLSAERNARWRTLRRQALGDGLIDAAAMRALELRRRPEAYRWQDWIERQAATMRRVYDELERSVETFPRHLDLGSIAIGCALGYVDARFHEDEWRASRPMLASWFDAVAARPSFRESAPTS